MMTDNFVLDKLVKICEDLASLNKDVETSFSSFQNTLEKIEQTISVIKNSSHNHEHQISTIMTDIKTLRTNYDNINIVMDKRIIGIEKQLNGYLHKPNWKKVIWIAAGLTTILGTIAAIVKFLDPIREFTIKVLTGG